MEPIILASASPRRQEYFRLLKIPFLCIPAEIDETPPLNLTTRQAAEYIARQKALAVTEKLVISENSSLSSIRWIFAADTIVVLDGKIYGKPADREEARLTLNMLAGKCHEVITAMALHNRQDNKTDCRSVSCEVEFAALTVNEIAWYLDTGEWQGAAGAYRLQEKGGCLIKSIKGSPSAVAGLPLYDFYVMLKDNGCHFDG